MQKIISEMLDGVLKAFMHGDVAAAEIVCRLDDDVDDLEKQIFNEMLLLMMENPRIIEQATALFSIARALERSADHVTNLAERVIYMETGKVVKASHFRRPKETGPEGGV
jgi:phosphate transport system protein